MVSAPSINSLLEIMTRDGYAYRSRVEDLADLSLTLAAPIGVRDREPPIPGDQFSLAWVVDGSRMVMPVRLAGLTREPPPCWHVEAIGEPQRDSRRRHVRGGGGEIVRLGRTGNGEPEQHLTAKIADLSESSLRCRITGEQYAPGDTVDLHANLDDYTLDATGQVLTVRKTPNVPGFDVVVVYDLSESAAQTVRRYLFQRQLAARRSRRGD